MTHPLVWELSPQARQTSPGSPTGQRLVTCRFCKDCLEAMCRVDWGEICPWGRVVQDGEDPNQAVLAALGMHR